MHASVFNRLTIRYVEISSGADYNPNMENNKSAKYFQNWGKKWAITVALYTTLMDRIICLTSFWWVWSLGFNLRLSLIL